MHTRIWIVVALALTASAAWAETTYVVKQGDRLIDICRAHDVSLAEVVRLNRIKDANLILLSGDPLSPASAIESVWFHGRAVERQNP